MEPKVVVVSNPAASQFTGGAHREVMAAISAKTDVEAIWPSSSASATESTIEAIAGGAGVVVAMGGDGMVHHVLQGVVGTDASLAIIPVGTTNVAARWLDIPTRPERAARLVVAGAAPRSIGLVRLALDRGATTTTHYAMFSAGFGIDAAIVAEADKEPYRKYRFGSLHYARTALGVALGRFAGQKPHVTVKSGDQVAHASAAVIQFRDLYTYFGRLELRLTPAPPDPMTVLVIERLPRRRAPRLITNVLRGRDLGDLPQMETWTGVATMQIGADPAVGVQADGEYLGMVDGGVFEWAPDSVRVIAPEPG
jgi:diacylglycerol kinase family enzyme